MEVNEKDYSFTASLLFTLTWKDTRAPGAIAAATAAAQAPGGTCARYCSYSDELAPSNAACCGGDLWLPSLRFRNLLSLSGSRDAVQWITSRPDDVIVWRVKTQATWFTNLAFRAFQFDTQSLGEWSGKMEENGGKRTKTNATPSNTSTHTHATHTLRLPPHVHQRHHGARAARHGREIHCLRDGRSRV